jgi:hypothetical protein
VPAASASTGPREFPHAGIEAPGRIERRDTARARDEKRLRLWKMSHFGALVVTSRAGSARATRAGSRITDQQQLRILNRSIRNAACCIARDRHRNAGAAGGIRRHSFVHASIVVVTRSRRKIDATNR